ncbi:MAG: gliding motility-associated C-terminal domain-containing protein [Candidatus Pacearchaeota archaeon]
MKVLVSGGTPPVQYVWSNGATTAEQYGLGAGEYGISVTDANGCGVVRVVEVENIMTDCPHFVYLPNVFSPNGDGLNDVLYVRGKGVSWFRVVIYNRWGNKVFESGSFSVGWDGTYRGEKQDAGVYVYMIEGEYSNGESFKKSGDVALIR